MVKTRLILLWIATSDTVDPADLEELLSYARLSQEYKDAIENISLLNVQLSKSANKQGQKTKKGKKKKDAQQEVPFDLSRYVPVVKRIVEGHIDGTIDQRLFPNNLRTVKQQNLRKNTAEAVKEVPKLRVYKTQWHKKSTKGNVSEISDNQETELNLSMFRLLLNLLQALLLLSLSLEVWRIQKLDQPMNLQKLLTEKCILVSCYDNDGKQMNWTMNRFNACYYTW